MQALLSEHWHAVRFLRPRLRDGVEPLHRWLRGRPWVLLVDPVTQRFHRMTPALWRVLQLLDGRRTLDEVWDAACADTTRQPDAPAISQHELVQLMASLYANDLLQTQVSPDAGEVFERHRKQTRARLKQSWLNPLSIRVPLLHPDAWFERRAPLARRLTSWTVFAIWLAVVAPAALLAWEHWGRLTENLSDRVLAAHNVLLLWLVYPVVKAVHECAHGLAVKAFGGTVREIGVMLIALMPVPYVDATSSYRFASKWARALVAAAGIMAELALGAVAVYVWLGAESGLVTAVAFNVILIAGVSTLLVNGNPLMRYDGYFVLCDLVEVPNLAQRAQRYWTYLIDRHAFGARDAQPPLRVDGERVLLAVYGVVAPIYRLLIVFGLIWFVATEYPVIGAVMAVMAAWATLVLPLWKGWKHLVEGPTLARRRDPALRRTAAALLLAAVVIGVVPLPFNSVHQAVVWAPDDAIVRAGSSGQLLDAPVASGTAVEPGTVLMTLDNPALIAETAVAAAAVAHAEAQLRKAEVLTPALAEPLRGELRSRAARLGDLQSRVAALQVTADRAGRWVPRAETGVGGRHVRRGEVVGHVVAGASDVVRTAITQEDMDLIRSRGATVGVRLASDVATPVPARLVRQVPGGEFELVSPALGTSGGGEIAVDPSQAGGTHTLRRVFDVELRMARPSPTSVFGERAHVRFDLGDAPLGWQWFLRLRQLFLSRLNV